MLTNSKVLGIDIYPALLPEEMPDNVYPQVDDLNSRWVLSAHSAERQ